VLDTDAIIVVEGRADVINLLKYGIKNAVAVEGTKVTGTIIELTQTKTSTAFLDGDRGGELILRELLQVADIDYVAHSPRGKSVEDMTRKEVIKALRNKVPVEYVREQFFMGEEGEAPGEAEQGITEKPLVHAPAPEPVGKPDESDDRRPKSRNAEKQGPPKTLTDHLRAVRGHHIARFLSEDYGILLEMKIGDLETSLDKMNGDIKGVVLDSEVNQKLLDHLVESGVEYVAAREFKGIIKRPISIRLIKIA
jgi:DNA primase